MLLEVVRMIFYEITHKNKTFDTIFNIFNSSVNPLNGLLTVIINKEKVTQAK